MIDIAKAIKSLDSTSEFSIRDDVITWHTTPMSDSDIATEVTRLQTEYDSLAYARSRKQEYDKLNQWEMQFDDNRDGTTTWVDSINKIKSQFPKG
jgi:hypothetical protein